MGWTVNTIALIGGLGSIMEGVSDVHNTNGEVVSGSDGDNKTKCRLCYSWGGIMIKLYSLNLRYTICAM